MYTYSRIVRPRIPPTSSNARMQPTITKPGTSSRDRTCNGMIELNFTDTLRQIYDFTPTVNAIKDQIQKRITLFEIFANLTNSE